MGGREGRATLVPLLLTYLQFGKEEIFLPRYLERPIFGGVL